MALPERLYYPLDKAIIKINSVLPEKYHLDIEDLLHFALIGELDIFCYINQNVGLNQENIEVSNYVNDYITHEISMNIFGFLWDQLQKDGVMTIHTNYGILEVSNVLASSFSEDDYRITILSTFISMYLRIPTCVIPKIIKGENISIKSAEMPRTLELKNENFPVGFVDAFRHILLPKIKEVPINEIIITREELNRFIGLLNKDVKEEKFTIEDYQKILYSLKELVCSKTKKWSQDDINNELDNIQKGMSKRRLESMWSMLNKKFKS